MLSLSRLFGRHKTQTAAPPDAAPEPARPAGASRTEPAGPAAPSPEPSAEAVAPQAPPPNLAPPTQTEPSVPLRSLERYRQDPAFQNFMDKARRPPGAVLRRPRLDVNKPDEGR